MYIYGPEHILEESKWDTLIAERQQLSLSGQAVEGQSAVNSNGR